MRPLYVRGGREVVLRLDGPSLVVEAPGTALRRFPLNRISYVVLCGAVQGHLSALHACAKAGVPVASLDASGAPAGFFLPWKKEPPRPSVLLEDFLARPDWQSRYSDWRRSQERRAMVRALRAAGLSPLEFDTAEAAFRRLMQQFDDQSQALRVLRSWHAFSAPVAEACLSQRGFCPTLISGRMPSFDLPAHLADINGWSHLQTVRALQTWPRTWDEAAASYEAVRLKDLSRMRALVENFFFWLGGARWR